MSVIFTLDPRKTIWAVKMNPTAGLGETDEEGVSLKLVQKNPIRAGHHHR